MTGGAAGAARERLEAAQRYAAHGWPVFPCVPGEKIPVTRRGFLDASTDPERITSWWTRNLDRNVAIVTGAPGPDAVDVDQHGEAGSGFAAWNRAKRAGLVSDPLAIVRTPGGGMHAYFAGTGQRSGRLTGQHLDFRARGGYVLTPPSAVAGRRYEVIQHQPSDATVDFAAIRGLLEPQQEKSRWPQPAGDAERPRDLMHLAAWVAAQREGNRNDGLFWAASRAAEAGDTGALEAIGRAAQSAGLDEREVIRTIRSAQRVAQFRPLPSATGRWAETTGEMADRAAHAARVACRDGQLERAAHLIATAMGLDPSRRDLWESHARQLIVRANQTGLRQQVTLRLLAAGIDANDPGLQQAVRHDQAPGAGAPARKAPEMDSDLNEADKARDHLNELLDRPGGQVRADHERITWASAALRRAIERQHRAFAADPVLDREAGQ